MESLSEKLKALGVKMGVNSDQTSKLPAQGQHRIEDLLPQGKIVETKMGSSFAIENRYSSDHQHGEFAVYEEAEYSEFLDLFALDQEFDVERCVFMDTETTGLAGGAGTLAFMVGLGFYQDGEFWLYQGFLRDPGDEPGLLAKLEELLTGIDTVVTYNGKSFDVPLMHSRCVINGFSKLFDRMQHIDLLHAARKVWKYRLPSRTLGIVENEILGFYRSEEEVPGWMAPELYFDYQKTGDASGVVPVFYHNAMDILTLGVLLRVIAQMLHDPFEKEAEGVDLVSIARMYAEQKEYDRAIKLYQSGLRHDLPPELYLDAILRFALIFKRQEKIEKALPLWESAVEIGSVAACEELAKYYEHTLREFETAIQWVNRGFSCLRRSGLSKYEIHRAEEALQHRLERLLGKWQAKSEDG